MQRHAQDLARFATMRNQNVQVPLPSYFYPTCFTVAAFVCVLTISMRILYLKWMAPMKLQLSYGTAITLLQIKSAEPISKPRKSEINLHDFAKVDKLPCQEINNFTDNQILRLPKQFCPRNDLFYSNKATDKFA